MGKQNVWPQTAQQQLAWLESRLADWTSHTDDLGITDTQIADLTSMVNESRTALNSALTARSIAKAATSGFYSTARPMQLYAGALIKQIRAYAGTTDDSNVYTIARIDPPSPPTPAPAPEMPWDVRTKVENDGSVSVTWRARNAASHAGTSFELQRLLNDGNTYTFLALSGIKKFNDQTVPPGTQKATYRLRATRGTLQSPWSEPVTAHFGVPQSADSGDLHIAA